MQSQHCEIGLLWFQLHTTKGFTTIQGLPILQTQYNRCDSGDPAVVTGGGSDADAVDAVGGAVDSGR